MSNVYGRVFRALWAGIKTRCYNSTSASYRNYGGRGIMMHEPWRASYRLFCEELLSEIGPRPSPQHSVDRVDNDRGYFPGNLRWATRFEQAANKRNTKLIDGMPQAAFGRLHGFSHAWVARQVRLGRSGAEILAARRYYRRNFDACGGMSAGAFAELHGVQPEALVKRLRSGFSGLQAVVAIKERRRCADPRCDGLSMRAYARRHGVNRNLFRLLLKDGLSAREAVARLKVRENGRLRRKGVFVRPEQLKLPF